MSRKLRIEYPGVIYRVLNRGDQPPCQSTARRPSRCGAWSSVALVIAFHCITSAFAVGLPLFPIVQDGKLGYINQAGETVIPARLAPNRFFDHKEHFKQGLQPITVRQEGVGLYGMADGYIDTAGRIAIEPMFARASPFSEGLAAVRPFNGAWGYINQTGSYVIPPRFDEAEPFSEGLAQVTTNRLMGYVDKAGHWAIEPRFRSRSPHSNFSEGLASVEINGRWGFINPKGDVVIQPSFASPGSFSGGLAAVKLTNSEGWGYITTTGDFAFIRRFSIAWKFSEGLARVISQGTTAFIDKKGQVVFSIPGADSAGEFSEGLVNVSMRQTNGPFVWGYVDRNGNVTIAPRFQQAEPFFQGLARVIISNQFAYINRSGEYVWPRENRQPGNPPSK